MRMNIVHQGADELVYEIREIVEVGKRFEKLGKTIYWENIGDPIAKGHTIMPWIKNIIADTIKNDNSGFGYCPTKGLLETREYLAKIRCMENGAQITAEDILFFNGLGDAIATTYTYLHRSARVLGPSPAYSTHSSAEAAHAGSSHLTYNLDPYKNWLPDIEDIRNKVKYNPSIVGILIINPDNPTGMVYPKKILEQIVDIAREFDLFIISDEIYANIAYGSNKMTPLSQIINDVPGMTMKGLSKEIPWPGARCGWIEFYNKDRDPIFTRYTKTLVDAKMLEVCATTLPQKVLPLIYSDSRFTEHIRTMSKEFATKANIAHNIFKDIPSIIAPKPDGAFYMSVVFKEGILNQKQKTPIKQKGIQKLIDEITDGVLPDKRFVYYLMASTGICVVPLSSMNSKINGFRMTLLEPDLEKFTHITETLADTVRQYVNTC